MKLKIIDLIAQVEENVVPYLSFSNSNIHGIKHLRKVAYLAGRFATCLNTNIEAAVIGGYLHDCARIDDGVGNHHAHKSAVLAEKILNEIYPNYVESKTIYNAIYSHADGLISDDKIIGCVWDADRLNLIRLGIIPQLDLLSTPVARRLLSRFLNSELIHRVRMVAKNIFFQSKKNRKVFIGIWYAEKSNIILQIILTILEDDYNFDFRKLRIISLYEYKNLHKSHDQSCCYQIYKEYSNRLNLDQIFCPQQLNLKNLNTTNLVCIISYEDTHFPFLDFSLLSYGIESSYPLPLETRNFLSRYYEKIVKTPDSLVTLPLDFYKKISDTIILMDGLILTKKENIIRSMPKSWKSNIFKMNSPVNFE